MASHSKTPNSKARSGVSTPHSGLNGGRSSSNVRSSNGLKEGKMDTDYGYSAQPQSVPGSVSGFEKAGGVSFEGDGEPEPGEGGNLSLATSAAASSSSSTPSSSTSKTASAVTATPAPANKLLLSEKKIHSGRMDMFVSKVIIFPYNPSLNFYCIQSLYRSYCRE